jgi:hypothetical protein
MAVHWLEKETFFETVLKGLVPAEVVLDIGCGIRPQPYVRPLVHICCEPFDQYLTRLGETLRREHDRSYVLLKATWAEAVLLFPPHSVDTVFLVDVVEHVDKEEALSLLEDTAKLARRQVAVFTPLGYYPQKFACGPDAWGLDGGKWQEHRSGWVPEDFDKSWEVYATREFHTTDGRGNPLEKPFGAMWALRTASEKGGDTREEPSLKEKIRTIHDIAVDNSGGGLNLFITMMRLAERMKTSKTCLFVHKVLTGKGRA